MRTVDFYDCDDDFHIRYRFSGKLFNLRRLQAIPKVQTDVLDELLYTDDLAKNAISETKCKGAWIECRQHVTIMALQSPQKD